MKQPGNWGTKLALLGSLIASPLLAQVPPHNPVPGGVAVLKLAPVTEPRPEARFGGRDALVMPDGDYWSAVVGLPCDMLPGDYIVSVTREDQDSMNVELGVIPHAPPSHVGTDGDHVGGRTGERTDTPPRAAVFNASMDEIPPNESGTSAKLTPTFDFRAPVESRDIVEYGRIQGEDGVRCHDYLSFFLAPGSQVYTPALAWVLRVDATREDGIRVVLDHGGGALSVLGNLRAVLVEIGQEVDQGEIIGTVGATDQSDIGRLDWAVSLNDYRVNPLQFSATP